MLARLLLALHRRRFVALAAAVALMALAAWRSSRLPMSDDYMAMLPKNDPALARLRRFNDDFRQLERVYIDVSIDRDDPDALLAAADAVHRGLVEPPLFRRLLYRVDDRGPGDPADQLMRLAPALLTEEDLRRIEPMLAEGAIRERLERLRRDLSGPQGMFLKRVAPYDLIGFSGLVFGKLEGLRAGLGDASLLEGRMASADGRHLMMIGEPDFPSSDERRTRELMARIDEAARAAAAELPAAPPRVAVTGGHRGALDNVRIIRRDVATTMSVASGAMIALAFAAYRRRWLALLTILPALFGALLGGLALSLLHASVFAVSMGFGVILVGVTVDYSIHILFLLESDAAAGPEARSRALAQAAAPIAAGAATTIGSFMLLLLSPAEAHRQMGVFAAIGLTATAASSLLLLPLLVPRAKAAPPRPLALAAFFERAMLWRARHSIAVTAAAVAMTLFCLLGLPRVRFEGELEKMNGLSPAARADERRTREVWGDAFALASIVARGATTREALERDDSLALELARMKDEGLLTVVSSPAGLLPSATTQKANLARWRAFWGRPGRREAAEVARKIGATLGYNAAAFDPFFRLLDEPGEPFEPDAILKTPLGAMLEPRLALRAGGAAALTFARPAPGASVAAIEARVARAAPGCDFIQRGALKDRVSELARMGVTRLGLFSALMGVVVLLFATGSPELTLATLAPLAVGALWAFGLMGWIGLHVDMANCVFIILIIGVGDDCCIFLLDGAWSKARGLPDRTAETGGSVTICSLATMIGCGSLVLARHPALFSIGAASLLGMGTSYLAALALAPLGATILFSRAEGSGTPRLWHFIGGFWTFFYLGAAQLLLFLVALPALRFRLRATPEKILPALRTLGRKGFRGLFDYFPYGRTEFLDMDATTFARPAIAVSNHQSAVDIPLIGALPGDLRLTVKRRVWNAPWLGVGARKAGHILVDAGEPEKTLARCRELIAEGAIPHFFPEGTRSPDGFLIRFHKGAFQLAVELGADVLPILLCDTRTILPRDAYWIEPGLMIVRALPRVTPQTFDYGLGARELMRHVEALMRDAHQRELDRVNTPRVVRGKVARRYRLMGPGVEARVLWALRRDPLIPFLDRLPPREGKILEIGCGLGVRGHWLTEFTDARDYLGVDADEDEARIARQTLQWKRHARFERVDFAAWSPPPSDAILLSLDLDRLDAGKRAALIRNVADNLAPGGIVLATAGARRAEREAELRAAGLIPDAPTGETWERAAILARKADAEIA